ncbi:MULTISPECIES: helix-turn-helix transcriptional regulator [Rhizobium]|uniref:helix-turn-helix transcriptional regulator n=1 Tax=Rhizobium TaxID=379 RepID=UPI0010314658|nr:MULTISPECIES: AlpA family phage regulatory protein [Rhizobium]MBB4524643.1 putative DNA-binding transcriptional regulator AlpA [Rhizobium leguminosarum]MDC7742831.1 AlpA family phage regulatory protein [Rhizobium sp. BC56]QIO58877.1 AlpA family phage regulatory protein [Rhizobium leguminosarum bv. trifolii]TBE47758.1 AlpA family phage regulatory protein [Rhizobium ruizarguesonis]
MVKESTVPLFVRTNLIEEIVGIPLRTFYEMEARGEAPRRVQTGPRAVAWLGDELLEMRERLRQQRDELLATGRPPTLNVAPRRDDGPRPRGRPRKVSATDVVDTESHA